MTHLTRLLRLSLRCCRLGYLPGLSDTLLALVDLDLAHNLLKGLPALPQQLTQLDLSGNRQLVALPPPAGGLPSTLRSLCLAQCALLLADLRGCTALEALALDGNP